MRACKRPKRAAACNGAESEGSVVEEEEEEEDGDDDDAKVCSVAFDGKVQVQRGHSSPHHLLHPVSL